MATRESQGGKNVAFYQLNAKTSESETPHFVLNKKEGDKNVKHNVGNEMFGIYLLSAQIKELENKAKGTKFNVFVLTVQDDKETCELTLSHNAVTYALINCLASDCNKLDEYSFVVGKKQSGKYWNGTCYVNVKGRDKGLQWSIDFTAAPKKDPVMVPDPMDASKLVQFEQNGAKVWNDTKVRMFWENIFRDKIMGALGSKPASEASTPAPTSADANTSNNDHVSDDDLSDLPF